MGSGYSNLKFKLSGIGDDPLAPIVTIRPRDIQLITVSDSHPLYASLLRIVCKDIFGDANPTSNVFGGEGGTPTFHLDDFRWTIDPADLHVRIDDLNSDAFKILGMLHLELDLALDSLSDRNVADFSHRISEFLRNDAIKGLRYRRDLERLRARAGLLYTMVELQVLLQEFPWHIDSIWRDGPRYSINDMVLSKAMEEREKSTGIVRILAVAMEQLCEMLAIPPSPQATPINTWEVRLLESSQHTHLWHFVEWTDTDANTLYPFKIWFIGADATPEFPFAYVQFVRWVLRNSATVAANVLAAGAAAAAAAADQFELDGAGPRGVVDQSIDRLSSARDDRQQQAWYFRHVLQHMWDSYGSGALYWIQQHVQQQRKTQIHLMSRETMVFPKVYTEFYGLRPYTSRTGVSFKRLLEHLAFLRTMVDVGLELYQKIQVIEEAVSAAGKPEGRSAFTASRTSADVYDISHKSFSRLTIQEGFLTPFATIKETLDAFVQSVRTSFIDQINPVLAWVTSELANAPSSATPRTEFPPEMAMFSERNPDFPKTSSEFVLEMPAVRIDLTDIQNVGDVVAFGNALMQLKPTLELMTQWGAPIDTPPYSFSSRDVCRLAVWMDDIRRLGRAMNEWLDTEWRKRPANETWVKVQSSTPEKYAMLSNWYYVEGILDVFRDICRMLGLHFYIFTYQVNRAHVTDALKRLQSAGTIADPRTLHPAALPTGQRALHRYESTRTASPPMEPRAIAVGQHMEANHGPACDYCSAIGTNHCVTCNSVVCRTHAQTHKH